MTAKSREQRAESKERRSEGFSGYSLSCPPVEDALPLFGKEAYVSPIGSEPRLIEAPTAHRGRGEIFKLMSIHLLKLIRKGGERI